MDLTAPPLRPQWGRLPERECRPRRVTLRNRPRPRSGAGFGLDRTGTRIETGIETRPRPIGPCGHDVAEHRLPGLRRDENGAPAECPVKHLLLLHGAPHAPRAVPLDARGAAKRAEAVDFAERTALARLAAEHRDAACAERSERQRRSASASTSAPPLRPPAVRSCSAGAPPGRGEKTMRSAKAGGSSGRFPPPVGSPPAPCSRRRNRRDGQWRRIAVAAIISDGEPVGAVEST